MKKIIDVFTGEVKNADRNCMLVSNGIGSCIVITAYNTETKSGAMAHIMLPGKALSNHEHDRLKYAEDSIKELLLQMKLKPEKYGSVQICVIGGGNVLNRLDDSICKNNITSVLDILAQNKLNIFAKALGSNKRRSVRFDIGNGEVFYTEGSSQEILLWSLENRSNK